MEIFHFNLCRILPFIASAIAIRVAYVFYWTGKPLKPSASKSLRTLIILGSGGHTAEMLSIVNILQKDRLAPRFYVAAATDNMSLQKARILEESLIQQGENNTAGKKIEDSQFMQIYRSREVGQSYITSIWTTLVAISHALWLVFVMRPQVIICNGPGTCIPLCAVAFLFKVVGFSWSSIFYVESIARVRKFSLSGLLLYKLHLADRIFVQWPKLQKEYPRTIYVGRLM
ncbi:UDP-N-acetylglucosamine transferase subunit ALG14 homolog [Asparagus officinalis]|uniref:UDP-N-acetylglucosamine transferase subunit ALG14 homolog n=1 Tax=Asparagus officinalis TaxID=4686 RepID=UPI00098E4FB1|nr:UDP-N-acetylglucosamine transferase subunit ALG14 homolog [Asparagus officinalis]